MIIDHTLISITTTVEDRSVSFKTLQFAPVAFMSVSQFSMSSLYPSAVFHNKKLTWHLLRNCMLTYPTCHGIWYQWGRTTLACTLWEQRVKWLLRSRWRETKLDLNISLPLMILSSPSLVDDRVLVGAACG